MPPTKKMLLAQVAAGEDSSRRFEIDIHDADSLAAEMAAFANSEGGVIYIGVGDDGSLPGLAGADVHRINQIISSAASRHVRSPLAVRTENVLLENGRVVIVLSVPKGLDKPYFDKNGVIWLKSGSDKRRVNSREELCRLFQVSGQFHADELPTRAGVDKLDKWRFRDFLRDVYGQAYPETEEGLIRLLQNMNLAAESGRLNLAGVLLFAEHPQWIVPQFVVKAIRYPGKEIHATGYQDSEDFDGPLSQVFEASHAFVMRNLHKVQAGRGVNAPGVSEIPPVVFEELLVNALVHRDYLVSAPIRLFVFEDRIEIVNPGHLPDNLTVEKIKTGNSNIRNPILVSYAAKGLLPYHGLGSGIQRALAAWPDIDFVNDAEGCLFTALVRRKALTNARDAANSGESSEKTGLGSEKTEPDSVKSSEKADSGSEKTELGSEKAGPGSEKTEASSEKIRALMKKRPSISIRELSTLLGITPRAVEKQIAKLRSEGVIRRVGPAKGGEWKVLR